MSLDKIFTKKHYELPKDDIVNELIIPAMRVSKEVLIKSAYFSNQGLAQLAPGLSEIIQNNDSTLKLLISIKGISDKETLSTIQNSADITQERIEELFKGLLTACEEDRLHIHAKDCLTYLLATEKAELRLVGMVNDNAIWHKKAYIFKDIENHLTITGSANCTQFGFTANGEELVAELNPIEHWHEDKFFITWNGNHDYCKTFKPSPVLLEELKSIAPELPPQSIEIDHLIKSRILESAKIGTTSNLNEDQNDHIAERLKVPDHLNVDEGKYKHQGQALKKLEENGFNGLLSIATGGGKTKTSLVAATRIQNSHKSYNLAILIIVPTSTLVDMWSKDVEEFKCTAVKLSNMGSTKKRNQFLHETALILNNDDNQKTTVMVCTRALFSKEPSISEFFSSLKTNKTKTLLIGDEAHGLGSAGFIKANPEFFNYKIGLSATPHRAFDEEGSDFLDKFFGGEVFNFEIKDAIEAGCLTPYKYYFHLCQQSEDEFNEFVEIQDAIKKLLSIRSDDNPDVEESLKSLFFKRVSLITQTESKIAVLNNVLQAMDHVSNALIFASAGSRNRNLNPEDKKQIDKINEVLIENSIHFHQLTGEESQKDQSEVIQEKFRNGTYQAITSMRVLDEGVNLPMANIAFLMGSSKSEREWIQRRGRVLRTYNNKTHAVIHDFVTLPYSKGCNDSKWIMESEIKRITAFVFDSQNRVEPNQGWDAIMAYREQVE